MLTINIMKLEVNAISNIGSLNIGKAIVCYNRAVSKETTGDDSTPTTGIIATPPPPLVPTVSPTTVAPQAPTISPTTVAPPAQIINP